MKFKIYIKKWKQERKSYVNKQRQFADHENTNIRKVTRTTDKKKKLKSNRKAEIESTYQKPRTLDT